MMMAGQMHPPIFFSLLWKRKRAVHGPKEKTALVATLHMRAKLLYGGRREMVPADSRWLSDGRGGVRCGLDGGFPRRGCRRKSGCKDAFDQLLFYCLALRRSQHFRHQCSTGSSFRAFRFTRKGYAASVSGKAANGCAVHGPKEKNAWRRTCTCVQVCLKRGSSEFVPAKTGKSSTGSRQAAQLRGSCAAIASLAETSGWLSKGLFF